MFEQILDEFTGTFSAVPPSVAFARLLAAIFLAACIGFERERRRQDIWVQEGQG